MPLLRFLFSIFDFAEFLYFVYIGINYIIQTTDIVPEIHSISKVLKFYIV